MAGSASKRRDDVRPAMRQYVSWSSWNLGCSLGWTTYGKGIGLAKLGKLAKFANFWRARSRLYQNEILQENMRSTAFFKLYKICILLHRCDLKIFAKNRFEKTAIFVKFQPKKIANVAKFANICQICQISA